VAPHLALRSTLNFDLESHAAVAAPHKLTLMMAGLFTVFPLEYRNVSTYIPVAMY
jgi:hypothetical protein